MTVSRTPHPMLDVSQWEQASQDETLVIADGQLVSVKVHGGTLVIDDGPMGEARRRTYARVPHVIRHVAVMTKHGAITLDAMAWMADSDITWAVIDRSGRMPRTLANSGRYVNPLYMRRQAMCAPGMPAEFTGVKIVRSLLTEKLAGQANVAEYALHDEGAAAAIRSRIPEIKRSLTISTLLGHEGAAADAYWEAWRGMEISFKRPGPRQPHWLVFPSRRTLRQQWESNRYATDPVNAMLNFGYHVAETECALACYASALSPAMGIAHVDRAGRDSFALDLMEVMRPIVDRIVIDIIAQPLDKRLFHEDGKGVVKCQAPLTHRIYSEIHQRTHHITRALFAVTALLDSTVRKNTRHAVTAS